jgi:hypothetical protein
LPEVPLCDKSPLEKKAPGGPGTPRLYYRLRSCRRVEADLKV